MSEPMNISQMRDELRQTQREYLEILEHASHNPEILHQRSADGSWTLAEVLVHISNARGFFSGEALKVKQTPGVKMGRTKEDAGRLNYIAAHGNDALEDVHKQIIESHETMMHALSQLTDDDLKLTGDHVKFGEQTLQHFVGHFIVEHDQSHVKQARLRL
ncbi:MAG: hypothetical protein NVSMB56_13830 [Pyrinomonadaceae bacterium]